MGLGAGARGRAPRRGPGDLQRAVGGEGSRFFSVTWPALAPWSYSLCEEAVPSYF